MLVSFKGKEEDHRGFKGMRECNVLLMIDCKKVVAMSWLMTVLWIALKMDNVACMGLHANPLGR
jgi:hypothetical protein